MSPAPPLRTPRFIGLLWASWWLAMAWLAAIAWQPDAQPARTPSPDSGAPMVTAVPAAVAPARPGFEDMHTWLAEHQPLGREQWALWQAQSQQALTSARAWHSPSYPLKELESSLDLLALELRKQHEASRDEVALGWLFFRLSRSNPLLRVYELERNEVERSSVDLSKLLLKLFAAPLASDTLLPNGLAAQASCPLWGELSQALYQLQKDADTPKGRRSELAKRSLSVFDKPDLAPLIHTQAQQCAAVLESRLAIATLARALEQVEWAKVFAAQAPTALATAGRAGAAEASGAAGTEAPATATAHIAASVPQLLSRPWMPAPLALALVCALALALSLRARARQLARDWAALLQDKQALQKQLQQLRAPLTQDSAGEHPAKPTLPASPAALPPPVAVPADPAPIEAPASNNAGLALSEPSQPPQRSATDEDLAALRAALARAGQQLRNAQLLLILGGDRDQALQELDLAQALLDPGQPPATRLGDRA